jgi:hypothetical protein
MSSRISTHRYTAQGAQRVRDFGQSLNAVSILLIAYIIVSVLTWAFFHLDLIVSGHPIWGNDLGGVTFYRSGGVSFLQRVLKDLILLVIFILSLKELASLRRWYEKVFIITFFAAWLWSSYINGWIVSISGFRSFMVLITLYLYIKTTGVQLISKIAKSTFLWSVLFALTCLEIVFANAQFGLWAKQYGLSSLLYYRAFGTFPTVFELCDFCTGISFLSSILIILDQKNSFRNWTLLILSIALSFYTGSRSALLGSLMILLMMGLYKIYGVPSKVAFFGSIKRNKIILDLSLIFLFICLAFFAILPIIQTLIGRGDLVEGQGRSEILAEAFSAPLSTVILGNGLGRSSRSLAQLASYIPNIDSIFIYSDSTINFFMIDLGLVGCLMFFILMIPFCKLILKFVELHPLFPFLLFPPLIITGLARNLLELYMLAPLVVLGLCTCLDHHDRQRGRPALKTVNSLNPVSTKVKLKRGF